MFCVARNLNFKLAFLYEMITQVNVILFIYFFAQMKKNYVLWVAALSAVLLLAGCGSNPTPAEFCEENGGLFQEDVCLFEDGSYCEAEAFANGECAMGENANPVVDEAAIAEYCVDNGGEVRAEEDASLCLFADGSYCEVEAYFNGECKEWEVVAEVAEEEVVAEPTEEEPVAEVEVVEEAVAE